MFVRLSVKVAYIALTRTKILPIRWVPGPVKKVSRAVARLPIDDLLRLHATWDHVINRHYLHIKAHIIDDDR